MATYTSRAMLEALWATDVKIIARKTSGLLACDAV
jgi:hypothetical protein